MCSTSPWLICQGSQRCVRFAVVVVVVFLFGASSSSLNFVFYCNRFQSATSRVTSKDKSVVSSSSTSQNPTGAQLPHSSIYNPHTESLTPLAHARIHTRMHTCTRTIALFSRSLPQT